ncbi:hypothetical protein [Kineococcus sp. SYSU DK006]|uniref:phage terminase small subunit n=1 Tax=Kineococcus sp. SYSU DK006 TaxID=3383127 RepID=UPI003D7D3B42
MRPLPSTNPRRRNRRQTSTLPAPGAEATWPIPAPPAHLNTEAAQLWDVLWRSPVAANWLADVDGFAVARVCAMQAEVASGDPAGAKRLAELRHLSEALGLTPVARRRLGWNTTTGPDQALAEVVLLSELEN